MKEFLIVEPFNGVFFAMLVVAFILALAAVYRLRGRSEDFRHRSVAYFYIFVFFTFVIYKLLLPLDAEYMQVYRENWGSFTYWNELPLNPCNVTLLIIPAALLSRKRALLSFCFYASILGPTLSLVTPLVGFSGYSLLSIHMAGFYFTHIALLMAPVLMLGLNLYSPRYRDILPFALILLALAAVIFCIDLILRRTGLCPSANYFFCIDHEGNPILMLFHRIIPLPFLCILPGIAILLPACLLITAAYRISVRRKERCVSDK